jgi:Fe-S-cluster containining protein
MDQKEIGKIFYRDGYRLAHRYLGEGVRVEGVKGAIRAMYEAMDGLLEAFLQRSAAEGKPASCRKGCAWCCHQPVFAVTHELLYLRDHVVESVDPARQERFVSRAREKTLLTLKKPLEELLKVRAACPFLEDGACAVYPARPMACRIYLSYSEPACRGEHDRPGDREQIPGLFGFPLRAGQMMNEGFVSALKQFGLHSTELPLEQGYSSVVTLDQDFGSWIG